MHHDALWIYAVFALGWTVLGFAMRLARALYPRFALRENAILRMALVPFGLAVVLAAGALIIPAQHFPFLYNLQIAGALLILGMFASAAFYYSN